MQTWPNFHQQGGHVRSGDHWQLLIAIRNRNYIFQSTHHSCVIHTSRIEFWWLQTWYCLSLHSYLALINYSHPLANEIIGMLPSECMDPSIYQSWIFVYFRVKNFCKMICGAVNRIFRILSLIELLANNQKRNVWRVTILIQLSLIYPKKRSKDNNVRFIGCNSKIIVTNNYWCSYY